MTITVTGLGSGLNYDSWIEALVAVKQGKIDEVSSKITSISNSKTALNEVKNSYSSLLSAIKTFTTAVSKDNVFNQKSVSSSSESVTAEVSAYAKVQNVEVTVSQLASATVAKSESNATSLIDSSTKLSEIANGTMKEGTFSIYINGNRNEITIDPDSTVGDLINTINNSAQLQGVTASLGVDGKFKLTSDDKNLYKISLGSNADTSNFMSVMSLTGSDSTFTSSKALSDTNTSGNLVDTTFAKGAITAGKFTIGNAEFEINATTTLSSLIDKINKSAEAGATAYWDSTAGKLVLTSTSEGAVNINVESDVANGGSNFTYIMGLTDSSGTSLVENTQTLGTNAILSVNGTQIISSSNTVTSDITGIAGLTLNLNSKTTSDATIAVTNDTSKVTEAVKSFVDALNSVIADTDEATSSEGYLYGESILKSIKNKIRSLTTEKVEGADATYSVLAKIGVTSKLVENSDGTKSTTFVLDEKTLNNALSDDADAVQKLLTGEGETKGVLDKLETVLDDTLDNVDGYFTTKSFSYDKQGSRYKDKVERMTDQLEVYRERITAKFEAMDKLIAALEKGASIFDSYFNKDKSED